MPLPPASDLAPTDMGPIDSADEDNNGSLLSQEVDSTASSLSRNEDDPGRLKVSGKREKRRATLQPFHAANTLQLVL